MFTHFFNDFDLELFSSNCVVNFISYMFYKLYVSKKWLQTFWWKSRIKRKTRNIIQFSIIKIENWITRINWITRDRNACQFHAFTIKNDFGNMSESGEFRSKNGFNTIVNDLKFDTMDQLYLNLTQALRRKCGGMMGKVVKKKKTYKLNKNNLINKMFSI